MHIVRNLLFLSVTVIFLIGCGRGQYTYQVRSPTPFPYDYSVHHSPSDIAEFQLAQAKCGHLNLYASLTAKNYADGYGVIRDSAEAYFWYKIVEAHDIDRARRKMARQNLVSLENEMEPSRISKIERRVLVWKPDSNCDRPFWPRQPWQTGIPVSRV
jgi:hypothetical protein